jgi:hypothetical protein
LKTPVLNKKLQAMGALFSKLVPKYTRAPYHADYAFRKQKIREYEGRIALHMGRLKAFANTITMFRRDFDRNKYVASEGDILLITKYLVHKQDHANVLNSILSCKRVHSDVQELIIRDFDTDRCQKQFETYEAALTEFEPKVNDLLNSEFTYFSEIQAGTIVEVGGKMYTLVSERMTIKVDPDYSGPMVFESTCGKKRVFKESSGRTDEKCEASEPPACKRLRIE